MRLTLVIESLGRGGAERIASVLAGAWVDEGRQVTLLTLVQDDVPVYPLHPAIELRQLRVRGGKANHLLHGIVRQIRSARMLRRAIRESAPDLIVSFMDIPNVLTLLATQGLNVPVIISERTHPAYYYIGWHWQILRRLVYHRADALVCMTSPVLSWLQQRIRVKGYVIPNPVSAPSLALPAVRRVEQKKEHIIVAMGRLSREKGFDLLLEAFSRVAGQHPDWSLQILGDGHLRAELEAQVRILNLDGRVEFKGAVDDPFPLLRGADLFVFSSRFEGFGNALCEAMACGLPAISFECPSGPAAIVRHGVDGLLVSAEDVAALAVAMDQLMGDNNERMRLAKRAPDVVLRFSLERILALWSQLFEDVLPKAPQQEAEAVRHMQR
jgi:glycosyltransferase involved in cell wall biosynthesis